MRAMALVKALPLPARLTAVYTLLLALALGAFGLPVYLQAERTAYQGLDDLLRTRAESVRFGKSFLAAFCDPAASGAWPQQLPVLLNGVDAAEGGVSIEVLTASGQLLATTAGSASGTDPQRQSIYLDPSSATPWPQPVPWDASALRQMVERSRQLQWSGTAEPPGIFTTVGYGGLRIRVYTLISEPLCVGDAPHVIQTARSVQDIERGLSWLRTALLGGGTLTLLLAMAGGWLLSRGLLRTVQRLTLTARQIKESCDFSRRLALQRGEAAGSRELEELAHTLDSMLAALEETYRAQQRFIADASHELRAPITSIRCNLDLLMRAPDLPAGEAQAALEDARAEAQRMGRLINDLLLLARSDEQRRLSSPRGAPALVHLDDLLLEVFRQYRRLLPSLQTESGAQREEGPRLVLLQTMPVQVYGDADALKQALVALLDNALKYTPTEGVVTLALSVSGGEALLSVNDTGIGIAPEDLPFIFERFYRADRVRSREPGGSGLGLAIVRSIVQAHGGSVDVESRPGQGSTFTIRLPLAEV
ncbi:sensor histidine kinase [Thermogemmatispora sp.]|uniref:sensor histidine kinase n=1 Tax=Thermogemmatispora sp. TaxID=1968838 RepID=UPI0035E44FC7